MGELSSYSARSAARTRLAIVIGLGLLVVITPACQFDRSGVEPWETGPTVVEDGSVPVPLDLPTVSLQGDGLLPLCGPGSCAGCCRGDVCEPGDTQSSCGVGGAACSDCHTAGTVCLAGSCSPCENSLQCDGEAVCRKTPLDAKTGSCVSPWNLSWYVLVVSAEINCSTAWDWEDFTAPDPFVTIRSGGSVWTTDTKQDTCKPEWKQYVEVTLQPGMPLSFEVSDKDYIGSKPIGKLALQNGVSATKLKLGVIEHTDPSPTASLQRLTIALLPAP